MSVSIVRVASTRKNEGVCHKAAGRLVLRLDFLNNGGFASARSLLRRAAEPGNADAALLKDI